MAKVTNQLKEAKLNLSENARIVLEKRYLIKDEHGKVTETPEALFRRVAKFVASADKLYDKADQEVLQTQEKFYGIMANLEFMPNSPTLMNAARDLGQLSACFVLPIEDSMSSIFETLRHTALIHQSGGGTGFSFSRLRTKGSRVKSTSGIASGPVSFMKVYDAATQAVKQGGTRRGANMGILRIDHPEILDFIKCKESDKDITNFNISVAVTDDFMEKLSKSEDYDLIDPHTGKATGRLNTKEVFDLIVKCAHNNGEPGVIFIDKINKANPTPTLGQIESTNPCGEQPLLPYESCNLGSINLAKMTILKDGKNIIDWDRLRYATKAATHFLDNVIDMNKFPLPQIEKMTKKNRKVGLGVMGWSDMLIELGIPYNSNAAIELAEKVMSFILKNAREESIDLAKERGTFPSFKESIYNVANGPRLRNATLTTIAPTGTISIIADASSGIEPIFALSYFRNVMDNDKLVEVNPYFEKAAKERNFYSRELMQKIAEKGTCQGISEVPTDIQKVFITSHDISPQWHIKMQAAFQKYVDNATSKTINFPHEATEADIREAYLLAYELGCKGITVYRDKSREEQVLNISSSEQTHKDKKLDRQKMIAPRPRPQVTKGTTTKIQTGCGNLYVTLNEDEEGKPFEVFMQMGKAGGCAASQLEALGRLLSLALRSGLDAKSIIDQLTGIRCPSPTWEKGGKIFSCADAIAKVIERRLMDVDKKAKEEKSTKTSIEEGPTSPQTSLNVVGVCPDCGGALVHEEGCTICRACGFSRCG